MPAFQTSALSLCLALLLAACNSQNVRQADSEPAAPASTTSKTSKAPPPVEEPVVVLWKRCGVSQRRRIAPRVQEGW